MEAERFHQRALPFDFVALLAQIDDRRDAQLLEPGKTFFSGCAPRSSTSLILPRLATPESLSLPADAAAAKGTFCEWVESAEAACARAAGTATAPKTATIMPMRKSRSKRKRIPWD